MADKPKQIQVIDLVRGLFEHIHGNLGLLRFSVEKLEPNNQNANKWVVIFSFYKTLSSQCPTKYYADVNLEDETIGVQEVDEEGKPTTPTKRYKFIEDKE